MSQLPAIIGVLVGSVATYLATSAASSRQWRRERHGRWTDVQMAAYAEHSHALKRMTDVARRIAAHQGFDGIAGPLPLETGLDELSAAELDRSAKWESVLMVGDPAVIDAGQRWKQCVWRLEWFVRGRLNEDNEWAVLLAQAGDAKFDFYQAVRRSLGTPGGSLRRLSLAPWMAAAPEVRASVSSFLLSDEPALKR